jgi:peptidoglycan hydrolase-like protein with peptidoglycan-binding domain
MRMPNAVRAEEKHMRVLFLLVILVLFAAVINGEDIDRVPEPGSVKPVGGVTGLLGCGPMRPGDPRADCVRELQKILRDRGAAIQPTGNYQEKTTEAVQQFQLAAVQQFQLAGVLPRQDGVVDEATLEALAKLPSGDADWDLRRECVSLRRNAGRTNLQGGADSEGRCVVALRKRLNEHGAELPDGDQFDEATEREVRAFQISVGLEAVGIAGPQTKEALYGPRQPDGQLIIDSSNCTPRGCSLYLTQRATRGLATASRREPAQYAIVAALTVVACRRVKALSLDVPCQAAATYTVDKMVDITDVADKAQRASNQNACLVVNLGYPKGSGSLLPLALGVDGGRNCRE